VTRQVLQKIWTDESTRSSRTSPSGSNSREEELAGILRGKEKPPGGNWSEHYTSDLYSSSLHLSDGTKFAEVLRTRLSIPRWDRIVDTFWIKKDSEKKILFLIPELKNGGVLKMETLLKLIFKSWVRMLIYISTRCGRDSHAKQLGRGCELTTIVWILAEHAGIFRI